MGINICAEIWYYMSMKEANSDISLKHIDVVDGIRAISVIIVMIFHFWQQTWIFPIIKTPWLSFISIAGKPLTAIDFTPFARAGYLFVDMMVLLSGFLLSLPLARCIFCSEKMQSLGSYFKKRAVRILPSYLFCIAVLFIYESATGGYTSNGVYNTTYALRDLISHLTFTHMLSIDTYLASKLDIVLWTLAVEVWYYILFPLIAFVILGTRKSRDGSKKHLVLCTCRLIVVAAAMVGISHLYIYKYVLASGSAFAVSADAFLKSIGSTVRSEYMSMTINQLPAFMGVYAVGLVGACVYTLAAKHLRRRAWLSIIGICAAVAFAVLTVKLIGDCASLSSEDAQVWQVTRRLPLALTFMGFILSAAFAAKWFRFIFSNKLMVILSGVSYNLYIWHQWLCVKLKFDWRLPAWTGDTPPNQLYTDFAETWKTQYAIIITVAAFAAAFAATYLIEKPAAKLLNGRMRSGIKK